MSVVNLASKLYEVLVWFHNMHPELSQHEVLDLIEDVVIALNNDERLGDGFVQVKFPKVPYHLTDDEMQQLAEVVTEAVFPSTNGMVH